jgi:hypothetical protein
MSFVTYTPSVNTWWDIVNTPLFVPSANGDPLTYDNFTLSTSGTNPTGYTQNGFQGKVLDNLAYLHARIPVVGTFTRFANGAAIFLASTWAQFGFGTYDNLITGGGAIQLPLGDECLPNGVTLNSVSVKITGSSSDSSLPATMPVLTIYRFDNAGNAVSLGAVTDASGSASAYKTQHALTVSVGVTVDRSQYSYWALVSPEGSTNSNAGMIVCLPSVTWTGTGNQPF